MAVDLRERGLRNPRHNFAGSFSGRSLKPLFIAPVRPMETVIGLRLQAQTWTQEMMKIPFSSPIECEYSVWRVPVSALGSFFVDMFTTDLEDTAGHPATELDTATGMTLPLAVTGQGHQTQTPLQTRDRSWAGEFGQSVVEPSIIANRAYAPYVSHAVWHIARMCYEVEIGDSIPPLSGGTGSNLSRQQANMYQIAPTVGRLVRSATSSMVGAGGGADNAVGLTTLTDWAERLSLVDNPNRTYYDYLKAFGVHPSRISGMPEPLLMQRRTMRPHGTPFHYWSTQTFAANPGQPTSFDFHNGIKRVPLDTAAASPNGYALVDPQAYQSFSAVVDETRGKRTMIDEPSFLVGLFCWWPYDFDIQSSAHIFDAIYMINSGTWGDPSKGSPDERDFLITRDVKEGLNGLTSAYFSDDNTFAQHRNDNGQLGPFAINMLNLYLNGDSYTNSSRLFGHHNTIPNSLIAGGNDVSADVATTPGTVDSTIRLATVGNFRVGIATDLVA